MPRSKEEFEKVQSVEVLALTRRFQGGGDRDNYNFIFHHPKSSIKMNFFPVVSEKLTVFKRIHMTVLISHLIDKDDLKILHNHDSILKIYLFFDVVCANIALRLTN